MHATVRRYASVDENSKAELTGKIEGSLIPRLSKLPGFGGYFLIESGNGSVTSFGLFDTPTQAEDANSAAAAWVREEKLETIVPDPPAISGGKVLAHKNGVVAL